MIDRRALFRLGAIAAGTVALRVPLKLTVPAPPVLQSYCSFGVGVFDSRGWWTVEQVAHPLRASDIVEFARYQDTFAAGLEKVWKAKLGGS